MRVYLRLLQRLSLDAAVVLARILPQVHMRFAVCPSSLTRPLGTSPHTVAAADNRVVQTVDQGIGSRSRQTHVGGIRAQHRFPSRHLMINKSSCYTCTLTHDEKVLNICYDLCNNNNNRVIRKLWFSNVSCTHTRDFDFLSTAHASVLLQACFEAVDYGTAATRLH